MVLGLYFPSTTRGKWFAAAALSFQGIMTEILQAILEPYFHRHGCVRDVLIDHVGLGLGALAYLGLKYLLSPKRKTLGENIPVSGPI